jgi:septal ring factor EnvC (AmiA/AmiB activator)
MTATIAASSQPTAPRSPLRCLLLAARKGRDRWKRKAQQRNQDLKRLKVRVRDVNRSRRRHAEQAQQAQEALQRAEQTNERLQAELSEAQVQIQELLEKKKKHRSLTCPPPKGDSSACP